MLSETSTEHLKCYRYGGWGHQWEEFQPLEKRRGYGTHLALRCTRCSTERHDWIDRSGALNSRSYVYPEGYGARGEKRPDTNEVRLEILRRIQAHQSKRHLRAL